MATENSVMAVIRASRPTFRNPHDKVAFAVHASFFASGYNLVATGPRAFSENALSSSSSDEVGIEGWNETDDAYAFLYSKEEKGSKKLVLVKCLELGEDLMVDVLDIGNEMEPLNTQIKTNDYLGKNGSSNYSDHYKNFDDLVKKLNSEILTKLDSSLATNSSSNASRLGTSAKLDDSPSKAAPGITEPYSQGPLWRGKKLIGKEALFVILGVKRFKDDEEKFDKFVKTHVFRLLKMDLVAVLTELERQEEVTLALKVFKVIQKQDWYKPDVFIYKDLIIALARSKKMDEVMEVWESMRKEDLFPDCQTYTEVIRGFLRFGSPADAMNIYEDMKISPHPPEELPFRILLKGLLPHPLLRNKVKQDFEENFPDRHVYDPPEEIFGMR